MEVGSVTENRFCGLLRDPTFFSSLFVGNLSNRKSIQLSSSLRMSSRESLRFCFSDVSRSFAFSTDSWL
ncbi:unnamed protein product, partial [Ixodes pacificus]